MNPQPTDLRSWWVIRGRKRLAGLAPALIGLVVLLVFAGMACVAAYQSGARDATLRERAIADERVGQAVWETLQGRAALVARHGAALEAARAPDAPEVAKPPVRARIARQPRLKTNTRPEWRPAALLRPR